MQKRFQSREGWEGLLKSCIKAAISLFSHLNSSNDTTNGRVYVFCFANCQCMKYSRKQKWRIHTYEWCIIATPFCMRGAELEFNTSCSTKYKCALIASPALLPTSTFGDVVFVFFWQKSEGKMKARRSRRLLRLQARVDSCLFWGAANILRKLWLPFCL